jgi:hypothetical protein
MLFREYAPKPMVRLIAVAAIALAVATSAQAMSPAPLHQPDAMITQVGTCGPNQKRIAGLCMFSAPYVRRGDSRRCVAWHGGFCSEYYGTRRRS